MAKKLDPKAKAKRQKIIAAVLGVALLGALAWAVPSVLSSLNKKPPPSAATAAPAAPSATPGAASPVSAPAAGSGTLSDSDPAPHPDSGQLVSFDRFTSKDPFVQQASALPKPAASAPAKTAPPPPPPPPPAGAQPPAKPTSAVLSVNGASEPVSIGQTFPQADPVFVLVSLTKNTAKVGIAGGSLSTGGATVTLKKGKKVTLMNTADGTRYELILVSVGG